MDIVLEWLKSSVDLFLAYGIWGLFLVSFAESSFFPVPPDLILIPLALLNPELALWYAFITTAASVLGGIFGYYIGHRAGRPILARFVSANRMAQVEGMFDKYGGWAVAIAGFTPIPYKVFTIASGLCRINKTTFITASFIGRGARFFLEGLLITLLGAGAKDFLSQYLELGTIVITVLVIAGYMIFTLIKGNSRVNSLAAKIKNKARQAAGTKPASGEHIKAFVITGIVLGALVILLSTWV